jgi:hypothetical protein
MADTYNVGLVSNMGTPAFTKAIKIVALPATEDKTKGEVAAMTLDYFFKASDLDGADKFFIYDPKVKAKVAPAVRTAAAARAVAKAVAKALATNTTAMPAGTPKPSAATSLGSSAALTVLLAISTAIFQRFF